MSKKILSDLDLGGASRILNLPAPASDNEPARFGDLKSAIEGLKWKDDVVVLAPGNVNIAAPGATIDGVAMVAGMRDMLPNQSNPAQNGIWIWNGAAVPMTRAPDASTAEELEGAVVKVQAGTSAGATFRQTSVDFVLDTDPVVWTSFVPGAPPASESTAGIAEIATQAETDTATDDARFVTPYKLANWSGRTRKFSQNIGDGSATQYDVTHNFNTRDCHVEVVRNGSPWDSVMCDVSRPDANTVRLNFAAAPTSNQYRVVILA